MTLDWISPLICFLRDQRKRGTVGFALEACDDAWLVGDIFAENGIPLAGPPYRDGEWLIYVVRWEDRKRAERVLLQHGVID